MTHLVGGISSAGRALPAVDGTQFQVARSQGAYLWEDAGRRYIDTALGFGSTVLGHADPAVIAAVSKALSEGPSPAFAHKGEEEAASALTAATGALSQAIFTNTGSEAVHLACRLARAHTGRSRIAKIAAGYDGWYDDVAFGNAGAPEADMRTNTRPSLGQTLLLRFNDFDDVERLFAECDDIAAILFEPMLANAGCIVPAPGYLHHMERVARANGAVLILDEVLTGFRTCFGLAGQSLGLTPDLATVGKAIGSGIAVAAVVGTPDIMEACARGAVNRAGTYSGNPVATSAVIATFDALRHLDYPALLSRGQRLRTGIEQAFARSGLQLSTSGYNSVFTLWFSPEPPQDYLHAAAMADAGLSLSLHASLRRRGLMMMPSPYGRLYISAAHDDAVIDEMIAVFNAAVLDLRSPGNATG